MTDRKIKGYDFLEVDFSLSVAFHVLGDDETQKIQSHISLEKFGNEVRKARLGQQRIEWGHFGLASTQETVLGSAAMQEKSAKRQQLLLDNALIFGRSPTPRPGF